MTPPTKVVKDLMTLSTPEAPHSHVNPHLIMIINDRSLTSDGRAQDSQSKSHGFESTQSYSDLVQLASKNTNYEDRLLVSCHPKCTENDYDIQGTVNIECR